MMEARGPTPADPFRIFVSYSRLDENLVEPIVRLLRAIRGLVFLDVDNLLAGQPWRTQIETAIEAAHLVAVLWCLHSRESAEVRQEYERAIACRKDVMPIILDSTPLPEPLGAFHGIDFREWGETVHHRPARHRLLWIRVGLLVASTILVLAGISIWALLEKPGGNLTLALGALLFVIFFTGLYIWRFRARRRMRDGLSRYFSPDVLVVTVMAEQLRRELLTRRRLHES